MPYVPSIRAHCQTPLPVEPSPDDPEPTWHQVADIPDLAAEITEHQGHARTCPCRGYLNRGEIPPRIRAHVIGPRLAAVMSYFSGRHHLSRRAVEEVVETVFQVPISLGLEGVEPTNNHAERVLRPGVLWRKNAFGCHSAEGCRFVERMLTVVQTLRLQKRPVLDFLYRAIVAHRSRLPSPQLLGQPAD